MRKLHDVITSKPDAITVLKAAADATMISLRQIGAMGLNWRFFQKLELSYYLVYEQVGPFDSIGYVLQDIQPCSCL